MSSLTVNKEQDIYFNDNYGKLYENVENGKVKIFHYKCDLGEVENQFIIRKIPRRNVEEAYYDIATPYGYGGPIILDCDNDKKGELISLYSTAFSDYCKENNIVSEFVRFHPLINNVNDFKEVYDIACIRKTLGTNLKDYENPVQSEFSKSCRKNIRKALNNGVSFEIIEKPADLGEFKQIYYSTMDRNNASGYYYFNDEYFENILTHFRDNIIIVKAIYNEKTIAQGLYFVHKKYIHIHLSGTFSEFLYLSPAYILRYAVTIWGKENGYEMIHHGGGRSNAENDGLFKFKKGFAKNTEFDFFIGKKIWNEKIYNELCKEIGVNNDAQFFPAYRDIVGEK
ncbi:peptidoglycan bridge formation glycyltransferase FemA/FemB family protein [Sutcliffiella horikoshii]|uniref:Lipid II:glycine glycyltransferase n=1 Tax=Sutcliffiella horikoshii TaxID=79883 RepID=A0AA94WP82_9BACI|nr:GNAT family N-acetyltransferase [Sutcliffiella horikoshii]TYS59863.1 peptidoglycan bridge formation glycyltransferase FemA/FemB family protein [Sutcliffiella horikoshii]